VGGEVDRVDVLQAAVAAAERGTNSVDDDGSRHGFLQGSEIKEVDRAVKFAGGESAGQTRSA
jgi:hypothetical protein